MDFDCKNFNKHTDVELDVPLEQVRTLHRQLLSDNIRHAIWFSGGGFHVWIMLDKPHMPSSGRENSSIKNAGRKVLQEWVKDLGLYCSDPAVPFDTARMIRIPNSYNAKRGYWSIPLSKGELFSLNAEEIREKALDGHSGCYVYGEQGVALDVKKHSTPFKKTSPKMNISTAQMDDVIILPCLNSAACQRGGNPEHIPRVYLAQYLLHRLRWFFPCSSQTEEERKLAVQRVLVFMESLEWVDWNEDKTLGFLNGISTIYDDHPTCATLYAQGLCIGKCSFHDGTGVIPDGRKESTEAVDLNLVPSVSDTSGSDDDVRDNSGSNHSAVLRLQTSNGVTHSGFNE